MASEHFALQLKDYVEKHKLESNVNSALNLALRDLPSDPFSEISRVLKLIAPSLKGITQIKCGFSYDSLARPQISVRVDFANSRQVARVTLGNWAISPPSRSDPVLSRDAKVLIRRKSVRSEPKTETEAGKMDEGSDAKESESKEEIAMDDVPRSAEKDLLLKDAIEKVLVFLNDDIASVLLRKDPTDQEHIDILLSTELQRFIEAQKEEAEKKNRKYDARSDGNLHSRPGSRASRPSSRASRPSSRASRPSSRSTLQMKMSADVERLKEKNIERCSARIHVATRATLAVSMAVCRAGARRKKVELHAHLADLAKRPNDAIVLPTPILPILDGGSFAFNAMPLQSVQICPTGADSFEDAIRRATLIQETVIRCAPERMNRSQHGGGFVPFWIQDAEDAVAYVYDLIGVVDDRKKVQLALDVTAFNFFREKEEADDRDDAGHSYYDLGYKRTDEESKSSCDENAVDTVSPDDDVMSQQHHNGEDKTRSLRQAGEDFVRTCRSWIKKYNVKMITDPFANSVASMVHWSDLKRSEDAEDLSEGEDEKDFEYLQRPEDVVIAARSLLQVSSRKLPPQLREGRYDATHLDIREHATVSDAVHAAYEIHSSGHGIVLDTFPEDDDDSFPADFAVALRCQAIRIPGLCGASQMRNVERLVRIERSLGASARKKSYAGGTLVFPA